MSCNNNHHGNSNSTGMNMNDNVLVSNMERSGRAEAGHGHGGAAAYFDHQHGATTTPFIPSETSDRVVDRTTMGLTQLEEHIPAFLQEMPSDRQPQVLSQALLVDKDKESQLLQPAHEQTHHHHRGGGANVGPSNSNSNALLLQNPRLANPAQLRGVLSSVLGGRSNHEEAAAFTTASRSHRRRHRRTTVPGSTTRLHDQMAVLMVRQNIRQARRVQQQGDVPNDALTAPLPLPHFAPQEQEDDMGRPLSRVVPRGTRPRFTVADVLPPQIAGIVNNIMADRHPLYHNGGRAPFGVHLGLEQASIQQGLQLLRQQAQQVEYAAPTNGQEEDMEGVTTTVAAPVAAPTAATAMDYDSSESSFSSQPQTKRDKQEDNHSNDGDSADNETSFLQRLHQVTATVTPQESTTDAGSTESDDSTSSQGGYTNSSVDNDDEDVDQGQD